MYHLISSQPGLPWTLLMAYTKAKLESNGDRASPCFKPFLIGNMSDKFLTIRTLLYVTVRHNLISLTIVTHYGQNLCLFLTMAYINFTIVHSRWFNETMETTSQCTHFVFSAKRNDKHGIVYPNTGLVSGTPNMQHCLKHHQHNSEIVHVCVCVCVGPI